VLLDMRMPGLDGKEAFIRMKQVNPDVRVLLSTGYGRNEEAQDLLDLGVRGLLCKPYQFDALAQHLRLLWD
ncbi:MAG: response regulator, partial [Chitinivibrionales bacterium]|nr:response regulator [Chitinivibrionales bacterium]